MRAKLTRLTHKIAIQLHLVAVSCIICSSRSRLPVRKRLGTPSYTIVNSIYAGLRCNLRQSYCWYKRSIECTTYIFHASGLYCAVKPWIYVVVHRCFGGPRCLHIKGEYRDHKVFQNSSVLHTTNYTASQPRWLRLKYSSPWKLQMLRLPRDPCVLCQNVLMNKLRCEFPERK
jgi:hypothetical protein